VDTNLMKLPSRIKFFKTWQVWLSHTDCMVTNVLVPQERSHSDRELQIPKTNEWCSLIGQFQWE
jgi:hypothetical protein